MHQRLRTSKKNWLQTRQHDTDQCHFSDGVVICLAAVVCNQVPLRIERENRGAKINEAIKDSRVISQVYESYMLVNISFEYLTLKEPVLKPHELDLEHIHKIPYLRKTRCEV